MCAYHFIICRITVIFVQSKQNKVSAAMLVNNALHSTPPVPYLVVNGLDKVTEIDLRQNQLAEFPVIGSTTTLKVRMYVSGLLL